MRSVKNDVNINVVRCLMNYMIVVMHAWAAFQYVDRTTVEFAGWTFVCEFLCAMAVPTFFMLSGYLMFQGFALKTLLDKLGRRVKRLAVPYLVWNTTFVLFYLAMARLVPRLATRVVSFGLDTWSGALSKIISVDVAPIDGPLWFLRALIFLSVLSPLFWFGLRFLKGVPLLALALGWGYVEERFGLREYMDCLLPAFAIVCYLIGAWLSVQGRQLVPTFSHWGWLVLGLGACAFRGWWLVPGFMNALVPDWVHLVGTYLRFLEAPALIALVATVGLGQGRFAQSKVYCYLKDMSFFAYAGHFLFCSIFLHSLAPQLDSLSTGKMTVLVLAFVGLGVPVMAIVYGLARRICPRMLRLWDGTL